MPENKEAFELSTVVSLAENVRRQEKELRELRKQLEEAQDEKDLQKLKKQIDEAAEQRKELEELKKQLEHASKQEKELEKLRAQLEQASIKEKELKEEKKQSDQARDEDLKQARGVVPQLQELEVLARGARKDVSTVSVSSSDSDEVLALAVMGATQTVEQLSDSLGRIEQRLHEIIARLQPPVKQTD